MNRSFLSAVLLAIGLTGCASEGGVVGSGISAISGNVIQVELESPADAASAVELPSVEVSLDEAPGSTAVTDDAGRFIVEGDFSGAVTLRFRTEGRDLATLNVDVPDGSTVVLEDIGLSPDVVDVGGTRVLHFNGDVVAADCTAGQLTLRDNSRHENQFQVDLLSDTDFVSTTGDARTCSDLAAGMRVLLEHSIQKEGSDTRVVALRIVVMPPRNGPPPTTIPARLKGHAIDVNCSIGQIRIDDERVDDHRARARIVATTEIVCEGTPCACSDLQLGDRLDVIGFIRGDEPGAIEATSIVRQTSTEPAPVRVSGPIVSTACAAGGFVVEDKRFEGVRIRVRVLPTTQFECTGRPGAPCDCAWLRLREVASVDGLFRRDAMGPFVEAREVMVRRIGGMP